MLAVGEIGIGNTTSAAALAARLLGREAAVTVGAGTGIDPETLRRKRALVESALARTATNILSSVRKT